MASDLQGYLGYLGYLGQMLRRPAEIAALAPASERLAGDMAAEVPKGPGAVIELGAATGRITRALLAHGVGPSQLHAIVGQPEYVRHLRKTFPSIHVHHADARDIVDRVPRDARAVVSSLRLAAMDEDMQANILDAIRQVLRPGGHFVQVTYGLAPPVAPDIRAKFALTWRKSPRVWASLPPARVYTFRFRAQDVTDRRAG